jgi:hypothetical protein
MPLLTKALSDWHPLLNIKYAVVEKPKTEQIKIFAIMRRNHL